jgi:hypothetical protein
MRTDKKPRSGAVTAGRLRGVHATALRWPHRFLAPGNVSQASETCGSHAALQDRILGAAHKLGLICAISLNFSCTFALAVAPSHSSPPSASPTPTSGVAAGPCRPDYTCAYRDPWAAAALGPAPAYAFAPAPAPASGTASATRRFFYLGSCGLIRICPPGQSAKFPLVAVPY